MTIASRIPLLITLLCLTYNSIIAQDQLLTPAYKKQVIERLSHLMTTRYVFPEVAKQTEEHLNTQLEAGHFDQFENNETFAEALTTSVQEINKDKHMRIRASRPYAAPVNTPERAMEERMDRLQRSRQQNYGFQEVKLLEGNIGYLDLRGFAGLANGKVHADAAMKLLARTDAIIFDLTKNGGGSPRMVQYLCSFFFDQKIHLNSLYWREGDETEEFWTLDEVGGEKLPDVPLFVMTSSRTFSGAEEFSYNMQTRERATLVGQTTGGGANPGGGMRINDHLSVFIPTGRAINPVTKTNWEGVGVVPEIKTTPEETFNKTLELAQVAAETYRQQTEKKYRQLLTNLNQQLDRYTPGQSEQNIYKRLKACTTAQLLQEGDINLLGYEYLMEYKKPKIAEAIFKANTQLHPNSANVYDSYAESLAMNGQLEAALRSYQKAVNLAIENEDADLELFKKNLETFRGKMGGKK